MNVKNYFGQLNAKSQEIFAAALDEPQLLGKAHGLAADIYGLGDALSDEAERDMLRTVSAQIELSCLALSLGLYRPAFGSLRLALELGFGCFYFSANKLAHKEWQANSDLRWAVLTGEIDGVLSERFIRAFCPDLAPHRSGFANKASAVYRQLSEFVHGNRETWNASGLALRKNDDLRSFYTQMLDETGRLLKFAYCCRHLADTTEDQREVIHHLLTDLEHISEIRELLGGPKEIK